MKKPACFIFAAGSYFPDSKTPFLPCLPEQDDFVIAADGGLSVLRSSGIRADLILGDFDSLGYVPDPRTESAAKPGCSLLRFPSVKDDTDMQIALHEGIRHGCDTFFLYGGTGGRLDHTLANVQCLSWLAERGLRGYLFDDHTALTSIRNTELHLPDSVPFPVLPGLFSVFAAGGDASGVSLDGFFYPLHDAVLHSTVPTGVSNEYSGNKAAVRVTNGCLLLVMRTGERGTGNALSEERVSSQSELGKDFHIGDI